MKPVDQTRIGLVGNCWAACVASLLELPIEEVRTAGDRGQGPDGVFCEWITGRGLVYLEVPRGNLRMTTSDDPPRAERALGWHPLMWGLPGPLCILCGPSPRIEGIDHCVVGRSNGWVYEIVHDPHPDRTGLADVDAIGLLVRLNPAA